MGYAIGIDAGATRIKAVACALGADRALHDADQPTAGRTVADVARQQVAAIERHMVAPTDAIGIAAPGLAVRDGRSVAHLPGRDMAIEGLDWTEWLGRETTVPVLNDGHAALVGEVTAGAAVGCTDVVMLTLGTGVGGILTGGRLMRGHLDRAGHLGHLCMDPDGPPGICGTPGAFEDMVSNATLEHRSGGRFQHTRDLVEAYRDGDGQATCLWRRTVWCLASGIVSIINAIDPERLVLGGGDRGGGGGVV